MYKPGTGKVDWKKRSPQATAPNTAHETDHHQRASRLPDFIRLDHRSPDTPIWSLTRLGTPRRASVPVGCASDRIDGGSVEAAAD
jgi:hypothetical protein